VEHRDGSVVLGSFRAVSDKVVNLRVEGTDTALKREDVLRIARHVPAARGRRWIGALLGGGAGAGIMVPQDDFTGSAKALGIAGGAAVGYLIGRQFERSPRWQPVLTCDRNRERLS